MAAGRRRRHRGRRHRSRPRTAANVAGDDNVNGAGAINNEAGERRHHRQGVSNEGGNVAQDDGDIAGDDIVTGNGVSNEGGHVGQNDAQRHQARWHRGRRDDASVVGTGNAAENDANAAGDSSDIAEDDGEIGNTEVEVEAEEIEYTEVSANNTDNSNIAGDDVEVEDGIF